MAERGKGTIITSTTMVAYVGMPAAAAAGASTAAVDLRTTAWAVEYGPWGVTVTALSLRPIRTAGTAARGAARDQLARQPQKREAPCGDILAHLARRDGTADGPQLVILSSQCSTSPLVPVEVAGGGAVLAPGEDRRTNAAGLHEQQ
jgi:NAD(P)-dependent dehydrogenase (short-subunit alcohol dehydrogenase family)